MPWPSLWAFHWRRYDKSFQELVCPNSNKCSGGSSMGIWRYGGLLNSESGVDVQYGRPSDRMLPSSNSPVCHTTEPRRQCFAANICLPSHKQRHVRVRRCVLNCGAQSGLGSVRPGVARVVGIWNLVSLKWFAPRRVCVSPGREGLDHPQWKVDWFGRPREHTQISCFDSVSEGFGTAAVMAFDDCALHPAAVVRRLHRRRAPSAYWRGSTEEETSASKAIPGDRESS